MRAFARYITDVSLVVLLVSAFTGFVALYWTALALLYGMVMVAIWVVERYETIKSKVRHARTPPRRDT